MDHNLWHLHLPFEKEPFSTAAHRGQPMVGDDILLVSSSGGTRYEILQVMVPLQGVSTDEDVKDLDRADLRESDDSMRNAFMVVVEEKPRQ